MADSVSPVEPQSDEARAQRRRDAKANLVRLGITAKEFAHRHNFNPRTVWKVLSGDSKARYGEGHRIAVALGIKDANDHE